MANAILTGTYIRSTFVEDQREFVEHFQYGKKSVNYWTCQNVPRPKNTFVGSGLRRSQTKSICLTMCAMQQCWCLFLFFQKGLVFFRRKLIWFFAKNRTMGPMGPRGLGPNSFSTVSPCPLGFFFRENNVPNNKIRIY